MSRSQDAEWWMYHPRITAAVKRREINWVEFGLLGVIWSLTRYDDKGAVRRRCFASDRYLAERVGVGERQIRNMLTHLKQVGLIRTFTKGKRRKIMLAWDRKMQGDKE